MKNNNETSFKKGRRGEDAACRYLQDKGYSILERNFVHNKHEVDIIAKDKNEIVFVEVKERATDLFKKPSDAVNKRKQKSIIFVANYYVLTHELDNESRFDIVSLIANDDGSYTIEHLKDAFSPSPR